MHLGVILQDHDKLSDVRQFIASLSKEADITLFAEADALEESRRDHQVREIPPIHRSLRDRWWTVLYAVGGNLPTCDDKHYEWRRRKLDAQKRNGGRQRWLLEASRFVPELIDFDTYLSHLRSRPNVSIDDIDVFLSFTRVTRSDFLTHVLRSNKPLATYLYSWDHPAKYHRFSRNRIHYSTWNESLKEDLTSLHGVAPDRIHPVGSTQLASVFDYLSDTEPAAPIFDFRYVLFAAAAGYRLMIPQEVELARAVAIALERVDPICKLVVRPYPNAVSWAAYDSLLDLQNVVLDDYREPDGSVWYDRDTVLAKLNKIHHARALLHIGSTIGLEASYFKTPVIHLALEDLPFEADKGSASPLQQLVWTYHAERYMLLDGYPNVLRSRLDLENVLRSALSRPESFLSYNNALSSLTPLLSMDTLAANTFAALQGIASPGRHVPSSGTSSTGSTPPENTNQAQS